MKKLSLLIGTIGGAMAGYVASNKKLRDKLSSAKDADDAAKILGRFLQKDGKKVAKQVQTFVESEEVQEHLGTAKEFAKKKFDEATAEVKTMVNKSSAQAKKKAAKGATTAKKKAVKGATKAKKTATKTVKKATTAAKKKATKGKAAAKKKVKAGVKKVTK